MKAEADGRGQREMHMSQAHAPTRGGFDCRRTHKAPLSFRRILFYCTGFERAGLQPCRRTVWSYFSQRTLRPRGLTISSAAPGAPFYRPILAIEYES